MTAPTSPSYYHFFQVCFYYSLNLLKPENHKVQRWTWSVWSSYVGHEGLHEITIDVDDTHSFCICLCQTRFVDACAHPDETISRAELCCFILSCRENPRKIQNWPTGPSFRPNGHMMALFLSRLGRGVDSAQCSCRSLAHWLHTMRTDRTREINLLKMMPSPFRIIYLLQTLVSSWVCNHFTGFHLEEFRGMRLQHISPVWSPLKGANGEPLHLLDLRKRSSWIMPNHGRTLSIWTYPLVI